MHKKPPFSQRTAWNRAPNRLDALLGEARRSGRELLDLTESNPTRAELGDLGPLVAELGHPRGGSYEPTPFGHDEAREAVAAYYARRGLTARADQVVLSASTSEAYGFLFKLLTEPGDRVLVPAPSYPLLGYLADLDGVELAPYRLVRDATGYAIDMDSLVSAVNRRTRAIALVSPNNPTGSLVRAGERADLDALAARHGIAILVDEVFGDYVDEPVPEDRVRSHVGPCEALTFVLSGLSKVALLPQLKAGWTVAQGPADVVREALARLELVADTYLSVSTPVQRALDALLVGAAPLRERLSRRLVTNLARLDELVVELGEGRVSRGPRDGGWYATLFVDGLADADALVEALVVQDGVLVHPGWFFDMPEPGALVVSLLLPEPRFAEAARRVLLRLSESFELKR